KKSENKLHLHSQMKFETMKYLLIPVVLFIIVVILSSCSTAKKLDLIKPEPDNADPVEYETTTSFINLPVTIQLKDIENQTNKLLNGLIYTDSILKDDDLELKVWKQAPIKIEMEKEGNITKIKTTLPLKVNGKYRYGFEKMGISLYDTKEFNLNGVVTLISDVGLTNWQLKTNTKIKSLDWTESPSVVIAGKNIPITYLINPAVRLFKSKIEKSIDDAIKESLDFKPQVLDALDQIATPFEMSEQYASWLRIVPIELYATDAILQKKEIKLEMGLKCSMETIVGKTPEKKFDKNKIVLKPVAKMPDHISANIIAVSTYADASRIMTQNFKDQEFGDGKQKVKVTKVDLWHKNGKMIIALDMLGSINGTVYLAGFPQYNEETKEIYFDQLDYVLNTKSFLVRSANWLAQGYVLRKIQESCRYSIKPNLDEGKANVMQYLQNYSPMKGVFVNGKLDDFEFQKIQLTNKAILAFIKGSGQVDVKIDGIE
ncbi:DUF4403 family protein, partial [uncultured Flavobacterium sp.]|uniref:DUF4403 family protein n=2 Tax=Flavobacterium TaxID=237 RepID=UPI00344B1E63